MVAHTVLQCSVQHHSLSLRTSVQPYWPWAWPWSLVRTSSAAPWAVAHPAVYFHLLSASKENFTLKINNVYFCTSLNLLAIIVVFYVLVFNQFAYIKNRNKTLWYSYVLKYACNKLMEAHFTSIFYSIVSNKVKTIR